MMIFNFPHDGCQEYPLIRPTYKYNTTHSQKKKMHQNNLNQNRITNKHKCGHNGKSFTETSHVPRQEDHTKKSS